MPFALFLAIAASLGVHALALFVPDVDLSTVPEPPPLLAELQPLPKATLPLDPPPAERKTSVGRGKAVRPKMAPQASAAALLSVAGSALPEPPSVASEPVFPEPAVAVPDDTSDSRPADAAAEKSRLPVRGMIRYRVDRGDQGFELGYSTHDWEIADGAYRITAVTETSGLVALFKALRIELESRGRLTSDGLQPERFVIRRGGSETGEKALFDWPAMLVTVGSNVPQALTRGAQDLLSFHYQLGFLPQPGNGNILPIATGKKYENYRLESLGDEEVDIPAGIFRTLHVRAPGDNTTELWLAYDYLLLPVKIRHLDRKGDSFVQVATEIQLSKD